MHRAIAITIEAKNNIIISFKLHKINIEMIKEVNDSKVVSFNFDVQLLVNEFAYLLENLMNLSNSFSEFQL